MIYARAKFLWCELPKTGFKFEAGAFLDGYAQFGSNMTEMGMATAEPVKKYANWLPRLFEKLKNDAFGYYNVGVEYEYRF